MLRVWHVSIGCSQFFLYLVFLEYATYLLTCILFFCFLTCIQKIKLKRREKNKKMDRKSHMDKYKLSNA